MSELTGSNENTTSEVDARRELLQMATDAAGIGTFDWDLVNGTLEWDDRLIDLFGYGDNDEFDRTINDFNDRLHPDDRDRVAKQLQEAIDTCGDFVSQYRIVHPTGQNLWIAAKGRALRDQSGNVARLLGAAWDITTQAHVDAFVSRVMESLGTAFFALSSDWKFTYLNTEAERVLGRTAKELLGTDIWEEFPFALNTNFESNYRHSMDTEEPTSFEAYYPAPLDAWFEVRAWRNSDGLAVYFLDITDQREARMQLERTATRALLLSRITEELSGTMEQDVAVDRLAALLVPSLADWAIVTHVDELPGSSDRRTLHHAAARHADPSQQHLVEQYARARLDALTEQSAVSADITNGEPFTLNTAAAATIASMLPEGEARDYISALAPEASVLIPLSGRRGFVGLLSLFNGVDRGRFTREDLLTIRHVAARAGLVMDNARLYLEQRELAEGLQRSMLTEPPEPDHMQVAVRYVPAAETAQVGGDWYDAFMQRNGDTSLVIGDVIGHDTEAAAAMGQVRTIVRTIGASGNWGPAEVLRRVDDVLEVLALNTSATVIVARVEQNDDERRRGISRLRWSNAGHPPPLVISADGSALPIPEVQPDLLLGVLAETDRHESEIVVDRGATVLLYTDGLVERRGQPLDEGIARLRDTVQTLTDLPLEALCDAVLERMLPDDNEDDVAIVAVRLHPQDQPRPPEAGPERVPDVVSAPPAD